MAVGGTPEELARYAPQTSDRVSSWGTRPQRTLKDCWYAAADLLLIPFPHARHYAYYVAAQALQIPPGGKPMIVTDLPSVREIVSSRRPSGGAGRRCIPGPRKSAGPMDDRRMRPCAPVRAAVVRTICLGRNTRRIAAPSLAADGGAL